MVEESVSGFKNSGLDETVLLWNREQQRCYQPCSCQPTHHEANINVLSFSLLNLTYSLL